MEIGKLIGGAVFGAAAFGAVAASAQEVNVYSLRQAFLVEPLFEKFTEQSGVKVNVIFAEKVWLNVSSRKVPTARPIS